MWRTSERFSEYALKPGRAALRDTRDISVSDGDMQMYANVTVNTSDQPRRHRAVVRCSRHCLPVRAIHYFRHRQVGGRHHRNSRLWGPRRTSPRTIDTCERDRGRPGSMSVELTSASEYRASCGNGLAMRSRAVFQRPLIIMQTYPSDRNTMMKRSMRLLVNQLAK